jgi:cytochrome c
VIRALLPALLLLPPCSATAADGRAVFEARCASCHAVAAGAPAGPGPNLAGLMGRPVGGDPDFDYSPTLQAAREAGGAWDAAMLERFLADPEEALPGNWMGANGLRVEADRLAVVGYFRSVR